MLYLEGSVHCSTSAFILLQRTYCLFPTPQSPTDRTLNAPLPPHSPTGSSSSPIVATPDARPGGCSQAMSAEEAAWLREPSRPPMLATSPSNTASRTGPPTCSRPTLAARPCTGACRCMAEPFREQACSKLCSRGMRHVCAFFQVLSRVSMKLPQGSRSFKVGSAGKVQGPEPRILWQVVSRCTLHAAWSTSELADASPTASATAA